jgi:hypothetical protein
MKTRQAVVGIFACVLVRSVGAATWYVATNGSDSADGTSWATAKQTIQAAIDLTVSNDTVLVNNGVYATGGRAINGGVTNRIAITNAITVRSLNGSDATIIEGAIDPARRMDPRVSGAPTSAQTRSCLDSRSRMATPEARLM